MQVPFQLSTCVRSLPFQSGPSSCNAETNTSSYTCSNAETNTSSYTCSYTCSNAETNTSSYTCSNSSSNSSTFSAVPKASVPLL